MHVRVFYNVHCIVSAQHVSHMLTVGVDGYLSDDERAVDGEDSEGEDGLSALYAADAAAPLAKEQFLQSALSDSVTNYLNALLNAKNNNQLVIVSSEPGVPALAGWSLCAHPFRCS